MADAIIYKSQQIKSVEISQHARAPGSAPHCSTRAAIFAGCARLQPLPPRPPLRAGCAVPRDAVTPRGRRSLRGCSAAPGKAEPPPPRHRARWPLRSPLPAARLLVHGRSVQRAPAAATMPPPLLARPRRCSPCMPPRSSQRGATSRARLSPRSARLMARARVVFRPAAAARSATTSAPRGTPQARARPRPLPPPVRAPPMREVSHSPLARSARSPRARGTQKLDRWGTGLIDGWEPDWFGLGVGLVRCIFLFYT